MGSLAGQLQTVEALSNKLPRSRSTPLTAKVATAIKLEKDVVIAKAIYATGWEGTVTVRATSRGEYRVYHQ